MLAILRMLGFIGMLAIIRTAVTIGIEAYLVNIHGKRFVRVMQFVLGERHVDAALGDDDTPTRDINKSPRLLCVNVASCFGNNRFSPCANFSYVFQYFSSYSHGP